MDMKGTVEDADYAENLPEVAEHLPYSGRASFGRAPTDYVEDA